MRRLLFFITIIFTRFRNNFLKEKVTETCTNLVTLPPSWQQKGTHLACSFPGGAVTQYLHGSCSPQFWSLKSPKLGRRVLLWWLCGRICPLFLPAPGDGPWPPQRGHITPSSSPHLLLCVSVSSSSPSLLLKTLIVWFKSYPGKTQDNPLIWRSLTTFG